MNNFEMNSARNDRDFCNPKISKKSPVVEIFSQMVKGKELKGFDKSVINRSVKFIKSLAEKAKCSASYIKQIESKKNFKNVSFITITNISEALGIEIADLFKKEI